MTTTTLERHFLSGIQTMLEGRGVKTQMLKAEDHLPERLEIPAKDGSRLWISPIRPESKQGNYRVQFYGPVGIYPERSYFGQIACVNEVHAWMRARKLI